METLLSILNKSAGFLEKYGIESPRLDAELLISSVLECQRMQLYLNYDKPLAEEVLAQIRPLLRRRAQREPLQYIIGKTEFMDFELLTDQRALIPRPETEELIELIVERHGQNSPKTILDLGTGTGAIACALARHFSDANVVATDIAADTLELARTNIQRLQLNEQIRVQQSNWFESVEGKYDLIVSNPPYLSDDELKVVEPELLNHEPHRALSSGVTGMEAIRELLKTSPEYLNANGVLYMETGAGQEQAILDCADDLGITQEVSTVQDLNQKHRFVVFQLNR